MRSCARSWQAIAAVSGLAFAIVFSAGPVRAADFTVSNTDELRQAILDINEVPDPSTPHNITLSSNITLNSSLTPIASNVNIRGANFTLSGDSRFQVFFVDSGTVNISNLTISNGLAAGGNGGVGRAGGGLGAGGGLFVNTNAVVSVADVVFRNNAARGGDGGVDAGPNVGGGGGGLHGNGGDFGGGGGGYNGDGGTDGGGGGGLEGNGFPGAPIGNGNGGGEFDDGDGGRGNPIAGGQGENGAEFEGGGFGSNGGTGGRFGGGGGGREIGGGDGGDFGGGGGSGDPGDEDDETPVIGGVGGRGGFGGGGGGSSNATPSDGGFGGGNGTVTGTGGAGSSLGGAVFVRTGGELQIVTSADGDITTNNSVQRALVGSGTPDVAGSDLYLMNGVTTEFVVGTGVTSTLRGSVAGDGGLRKDGEGTLVLAGSNSFTGDSTVMQGVLQGTTGSFPGDIVVESGAIVRFEQSNAGSYSGVLSGAGGLEKSGTGTVALSGDNSYTGPTVIDEGVLSVSTDTLPGATNTLVNVDGTLRFEQNFNGSFGAPITGDGTLDKAGSGRVTLLADYGTWAGTTTVRGGELDLGGAAILGGTVDVRTNGRLAGNGRATGDVSVAGTLAPGSAGTIDTLTIDGDLTVDDSATFEVDVQDAANASDQVDVGGQATLSGNSLVTVIPASGDYSTTRVYDILFASGGISGIPSVQNDFCFFTTGLGIAGNTLQLTLTEDLQLDGACSQSKNQRAVGSALVLDDVIDDPELMEVRDSLNVLTQSEVPHALDQMGGEGLAGFGNARLAVATQFLGALSQRMRHPDASDGAHDDGGVPYPLSMTRPLLPSLGTNAALAGSLDASSITTAMALPGVAANGRRHASPFSFVSLRGESGLGGWLDGFATFASIEGTGGGTAGAPTNQLPDGTHDTDFNLYGTSGGVDWSITDSVMLGAAAGYTRSKLSVSDLTTWGTGDTFQGAVYGAFSTDLFYLGGVARYAYTTMETTRRVSFGGLYEKADGDFDGSSLSGYAEAGLASLELAEFFFQPSASFQYTYVDTEEFTETGAPGLNLNVDSENFSSIVTNLGVRVYRPFSMDPRTDIVPELRVRWAHEFGDLDRNVAARFDDVTTGPALFEVKGAEVGRDVAVVGVGWTVVGEGNVSLSLNYDATLNEDIVAHTATLGVLIYW